MFKIDRKERNQLMLSSIVTALGVQPIDKNKEDYVQLVHLNDADYDLAEILIALYQNRNMWTVPSAPVYITGYRCSLCGSWVPHGQTHSCTVTAPYISTSLTKCLNCGVMYDPVTGHTCMEVIYATCRTT